MRKLRHWRPFGWSRALLLLTTVWVTTVLVLAVTGGIHD